MSVKEKDATCVEYHLSATKDIRVKAIDTSRIKNRRSIICVGTGRGVGEGSDLVAEQCLTHSGFLLIDLIGVGNNVDGKIRKSRGRGHHNVEAFGGVCADCDGVVPKAKTHIGTTVAHFIEHRFVLIVKDQRCRAPEHLVFVALHNDGFDCEVLVVGGLDGDLEECAEVAEAEGVGVGGAEGGHGVVDDLVAVALLVGLYLGEGDGDVVFVPAGDLAGGVEGQEVLVGGEGGAVDDGGVGGSLGAFFEADGALGVVDFDQVACLPAGVVFGVDVGFGVGLGAVVLVLLDGGGEDAAEVVFLAGGDEEDGEGGKCQ